RRATLERLDLAGPHWTVPPTFPDGRSLHEATLVQGLEGVVSKRVSSRYLPGRRSDDWRKNAHRTSRSLVIGGWRPEAERPGRLGAVLVGVPGPAGLRYRGRVGAGLAGRAGEALLADLRAIERADNPFADDVPREDSTGTTWVAPIHVAEVSALGLSGSGRLRQPAYRGLRPDLTAADVSDDDA
ncbi:MAG TPA: hypothetical protein VHM65_09485, partial [Candidatus Lustribacter sp.]|nr:hypothetical protein [Candidatus Lustribacter sp.]